MVQVIANTHPIDEANLSQPIHQDDLSKLLNLDQEHSEQNQEGLFSWIEAYLKHSTHTNSLEFNNRMWSGANLPSILAEVVVALKNTSSCTYESAPVAVLMEQYMLDTMAKIIGFDACDGQMTTGSSNANMIAMMVARNQVSMTKTDGLFGQKPLFAFVSEDAHYSFDKSANILGIGLKQLIKVPLNSSGQMDTVVLESKIQDIIQQGGQPFFIGATLGTTVRGAFDSISDLLPIKEKYQLWLHGDGAWGGGVIMNDELKVKFLPDLSRLDSFTMDFHKMLNTALMCNFLLVNHRGLLCQTCANGDTSYIFHDLLDLGVSSLQCGRRVDSFKWFLDWKFFKKSGFSKRVMHYYQLVSYATSVINASDKLQFVVQPTSFNLCFHYQRDSSVNEFNKTLRNTLHQEGLALLSTAYIKGVFIFRLLMTHPEMSQKTVDNILNNITKTGDLLCQS